MVTFSTRTHAPERNWSCWRRLPVSMASRKPGTGTAVFSGGARNVSGTLPARRAGTGCGSASAPKPAGLSTRIFRAVATFSTLLARWWPKALTTSCSLPRISGSEQVRRDAHHHPVTGPQGRRMMSTRTGLSTAMQPAVGPDVRMWKKIADPRPATTGASGGRL